MGMHWPTRPRRPDQRFATGGPPITAEPSTDSAGGGAATTPVAKPKSAPSSRRSSASASTRRRRRGKSAGRRRAPKGRLAQQSVGSFSAVEANWRVESPGASEPEDMHTPASGSAPAPAVGGAAIPADDISREQADQPPLQAPTRTFHTLNPIRSQVALATYTRAHLYTRRALHSCSHVCCRWCAGSPLPVQCQCRLAAAVQPASHGSVCPSGRLSLRPGHHALRGCLCLLHLQDEGPH